MPLPEELKEIRKKVKDTIDLYIPDWKAQLPEGSLWFPGSKGKPGCKICMGMGWLRKDVGVYDKDFGKLFLCDCVNEKDQRALEFERSRLPYKD